MAAGRCYEACNVSDVVGDDDVVIAGQADESGVDGVALVGRSEEHPGAATEVVVERGDINAGEGTGERCLPPGAAAPDLRHNSSMRSWWFPGLERSLQPPPHRAIPPLGGDQGAAVENEGHAAPRLPRGARAPAAVSRSARACAAISS